MKVEVKCEYCVYCKQCGWLMDEDELGRIRDYVCVKRAPELIEVEAKKAEANYCIGNRLGYPRAVIVCGEFKLNTDSIGYRTVNSCIGCVYYSHGWCDAFFGSELLSGANMVCNLFVSVDTEEK